MRWADATPKAGAGGDPDRSLIVRYRYDDLGRRTHVIKDLPADVTVDGETTYHYAEGDNE